MFRCLWSLNLFSVTFCFVPQQEIKTKGCLTRHSRAVWKLLANLASVKVIKMSWLLLRRKGKQPVSMHFLDLVINIEAADKLLHLFLCLHAPFSVGCFCKGKVWWKFACYCGLEKEKNMHVFGCCFSEHQRSTLLGFCQGDFFFFLLWHLKYFWPLLHFTQK